MHKTRLTIAGLLCLLALGGGGAHGQEAAAGLQAQIAQLEAERGPFSARLAEPLMALAEMQMAAGLLPEAQESLRRAQNIIHRSQGVHSPAQLEAVAGLTRVALAAQDWQGANQQQEFVFFTLQRHHGPGAPETFDAYLHLARWYLRTGQPLRAGRLLRDAAKGAASRDQRLALALLMERARRLQGVCCKAQRLEEALAAAGDGAGDPDALAEAHLTLADSLLLGRQMEAAQARYAAAASSSPASANAPPRPISVKRALDSGHTDAITLRPRPSPFGTRLERMSPQQQLEDWSQPPGWFILDGERTHLDFKGMDLRDPAAANAESRALAGSPLKFSRVQLKNLLPASLREPEALTGIRVELAFAVTPAGRPDGVEVLESNAPKRLDRLLVTALKKTLYRPRLVDGVPVRSEDVRLVQTFAPQDIRL